MNARSRSQTRRAIRALAIPFVTTTLSLTLPAMLTDAGLGGLPGAEPVALAQGDAVTEVARQRYNEGIKAFDAGKYEDARAAFLQAYALKRHPATLLNIGQAELRSNHHDDAGNHLQQFIREHTTATPEQKALAQKGIDEAKRKSGYVIVICDAQGADILVDGSSVGKTPLLDPVFVKPGKHTFSASFQGHTAVSAVDAKAGTAATASLTLGIQGAAVPPPPPVMPPVQPPPVAPPVQPPPFAPPAQPPPMPPPSQPPMFGPMGPPGPMPDQVSHDREPFFSWYRRKPLAWVGTGVTGLGLIGGIAFSAAASSASAASKDHVAQIKTEDATNPGFNPTRRTNICGDADGNGAIAHYANACSLVQKDISAYNTNVALSATSWVLFGLGAVGTTLYVIFDWLPGKPAPSTAIVKSDDGPHILGVAPIISPTDRGFGMMGVF